MNALWTYGFIQSKCGYWSWDEMKDVVARHRALWPSFVKTSYNYEDFAPHAIPARFWAIWTAGTKWQ